MYRNNNCFLNYGTACAYCLLVSPFLLFFLSKIDLPPREMVPLTRFNEIECILSVHVFARSSANCFFITIADESVKHSRRRDHRVRKISRTANENGKETGEKKSVLNRESIKRRCELNGTSWLHNLNTRILKLIVLSRKVPCHTLPRYYLYACRTLSLINSKFNSTSYWSILFYATVFEMELLSCAW